MISGLIGKKVGMTQVIQADGTVVPVTVVQAGPCVVVQKKTVDKDGYEAVQLGFVEFIKPKRVTKGMTGHFKKAGTAPLRILREMRVEGEDSPKAGDKVLCDITSTAAAPATDRCFTARRVQSAHRLSRLASSRECEWQATWVMRG